MLMCLKCKTQLLCTRSNVAAEYNQNRIFPGAIYECPTCKIQILKCKNHTIADPDHRFSEKYINMEKRTSKIDHSGSNTNEKE